MTQSVKQWVKYFLTRAGCYQRLKISTLYNIYCLVANRHEITNRCRDAAFYRGILYGLRKGDLIFDVGANLGHKTQIFLDLGARVISIEPDKSSQEILRKSFHSLRFRKKPVTIVGKAVSDKTGSEIMWLEKPGSAFNTLNPKWVHSLQSNGARFGKCIEFPESQVVDTVTMEDLFNAHGRPFFIKIDVEGHEAKVLSGMRRAVPFVSFEVNFPEFRSEGLQCIDCLERISSGGSFNYTADTIRGLAFKEWLPSEEFVIAFKKCEEFLYRGILALQCHGPSKRRGKALTI